MIQNIKREEQKTEAQTENNNIIDLSPNVSIITLNINHLNTPIKSRDCQNGFKTKNKAYLYAVYKKLTLNIMI